MEKVLFQNRKPSRRVCMQVEFVQSLETGIEKAKEILYQKIDYTTVLFLSGGRSPKPLYESIANEKVLHPIASALIDERYGEPFHINSNEAMLRDTGLLTYFKNQHIPFCHILEEGLSREQTAQQYDEALRRLLFNFPKSLAMVSLGADGHTAGLAPSTSLRGTKQSRRDEQELQLTGLPNPSKNSGFTKTNNDLVTQYNDTKGSFGERITLTFKGLEHMDYFILWVFGKEKRKALQRMFTKGSVEEVPGRFYNQPEIAKKTILITDIHI